MNKTLLTIIFLSISSPLLCQVWEDNLRRTNNKPTISEKITAFDNYRKTHEYTKGNGYKPYAREINFIQERTSNNNPFVANALYLEWEKQKKKNNEHSSMSNWVAMGPINTPISISSGKKRGNGRVNCIAFDPFDPNVIWIGSPAGGLWKSEDGGSNWATNTDNLPVLGVSHIAIDPVNNQTMYIVTGDAYASDTYSIGILKSIDGGNSWATTGLSYEIDEEKTVNKVIINPSFTDSLYAVTNSNILISPDAGDTWEVVGFAGRWRDIEFKPGDQNVIYAAKQSSGGSSVFKSVDGGSSWNIIDSGMSGSRYRPLIAVTNANPEVIYALFSASDYSFHGLYKSSDEGENWVLQSNSPNILGRDTDGTSTGGQSWYDLSLGASPGNEELVYVGGINLWKSNDGGLGWDIDGSSGNGANYSYMHVDQHALEFNPHTGVAYAGNDGGIYKYMDNLNKWVDISDGLEISQFYNLGLCQTNPNKIIAGAQDNGTEMLTNANWDAIMGGDGMECAIDHFDDNILYAEYQYGGLRKSYDGGNNWDNIKPVNYEGGWNTPYKMHETNNNLIVIGYNEVYRSATAGSVWDSISYNVSGGQAIRNIALARSNEDYIYAGSYTKLEVTKDAGQNWQNIKIGLPNNIGGIAVSKNNADRAWAVFSNYNNIDKVYETIDAGNTWENISGVSLPALPVNCIVHQGGVNDEIYIGTDIGVYYKTNTMSEWSPFNTGLPSVIVEELAIHYQEGTISAATFGRGVWKSPLNSPPNGIINDFQNISFSVFPNPTSNFININTNASDFNVTIVSLTGQIILQKKSKKINISNLPKGCYIIELISGDIIKRRRIIIK
tara:strand:- start:26207 stop:28717 length:2511 start_codon:yes stop_codon:yes gene_type:complete